MPTLDFTDQLGRTVALPHWPPRRIVSLVPSQTELLHHLGLEKEVTGITKFCVHPPEWFRTKPRIGGTKTVHFEKIQALEPDLILGNKEENDREQIEALAARFPVWLSDVFSLGTALDMIGRIGGLSGKTAEAAQLTAEIEAGFARITPPDTAAPGAAYLIWRKPYMAVGAHTFVDDMLGRAGFTNVFAGRDRYPEISLAELAAARPQVILLSSEPYPFAEKHFPALREACPGAQLRLVDGEMFSWYGSRLLKTPAYFQGLRQSLAVSHD